jgi:type 1 glutamine amidotransferase/sugar phosphate isomerase/epimerase
MEATMNKIAGRVTVFASLVFAFFQFVGGVSSASAQGPGYASVRPTTDSDFPAQIRTAVGKLMGWQVGIFTNDFPDLTFSEAATLADALGLEHLGGDSSQKVSPGIDRNLDYNLSPEDLAFVKQRLNALALEMDTYRLPSIPSDQESRQKLFAFAKELGVAIIVTDAMPSSLQQLDTLASQNDINVAVESRDDPKDLVNSINGLSPRIGVSANFAQWMEHGISPVGGLATVKDRLMVAEVRDRSNLGADAHDVPLGTGVGDLQRFFYEVAVLEPKPEERPNACVNCSRPYGGTTPLFIALGVNPWAVTLPTPKQHIQTQPPRGGRPRTFAQPGVSGGAFADLWQAAADLEKVMRPAMGYRIDEDALLIPITSSDRVPAEVKEKIEAGLPRTAAVPPKSARKLLVIDLCPAGGFYHDTIATANFAVQKLAEYTGAFQPIFSNDLNNLKYPKILNYDAVFLNSIVGEVFSDPAVLDGLIRFVRQGGGLMALHGASFASTDIPAFGNLIGAQSGPHHVETATLKIDDPDSPLTKQFASSPLTAQFDGKAFTYTDEFYHFLPTGPYSRQKLHVLISIDDAKTPDIGEWHIRSDQDYGLVWIRSYGKGRVFNCALGHTQTFFETPALARMFMNAIQFVDGDLPADTTPSAMLAGK